MMASACLATTFNGSHSRGHRYLFLLEGRATSVRPPSGRRPPTARSSALLLACVLLRQWTGAALNSWMCTVVWWRLLSVAAFSTNVRLDGGGLGGRSTSELSIGKTTPGDADGEFEDRTLLSHMSRCVRLLASGRARMSVM